VKLRLLVALSVFWAEPIAAQTPTLVPDEPTCARCTIKVEDVIRLDLPAEALIAGGVGRQVGVVTTQDGQGRYWVFLGRSQPPLIYSAHGDYLGQFARNEGVPNQYHIVAGNAWPLPGDSTLLWDGGRYRVIAPDLSLARTVVPGRGTSLALGSSRELVVVRWPAEVLIGMPPRPTGPQERGPSGGLKPAPTAPQPYAVVSMAGAEANPTRQFGLNDKESMTAASGGGFWAWGSSSYRVERVDAQGSSSVLQRRPAWFQPDRLPPTFATPPEAFLQSVVEDKTGRLWVFANVPTDGWSRANAANASSGIYKTRIEVIDPKTARVVATSTLDIRLHASLPGGRAAVHDFAPDGSRSVRIVQLTLIQP
jgi:hypothetical protein